MSSRMSQQKLQEVVHMIRDIAHNGDFTVLRNNKTASWKNQLLNAISDDVVRNHLMCLHPFQYYKYGKTVGVLEFKANWYASNIYFKVDVNMKEVLSFHYDDVPEKMNIGEDVEYGTIQIVTEKRNYTDVARFAIGSSVTSVPVNVIYEDDGTQWIMAQQYTNAVQNMATKSQLAAIKRVECISKELTEKLLGPANDYNILTYTEGQLRLVSTCYDIWRNNPGNIWLADEMLDIILRQAPAIQKQFAEQLYKDMPALPLTREF